MENYALNCKELRHCWDGSGKWPRELVQGARETFWELDTRRKSTSVSLVPYQKRLPFPPLKCALIDRILIISKFFGASCVITYYTIPELN